MPQEDASDSKDTWWMYRSARARAWASRRRRDDEDREKCFFAYLPARTFAYPKGARTPESDRMLREKGFERTLELQSADAATLLSRVDQLAKDRATAVFEASRLTSGELDAVLLRCRAAGLDLLGLNELPLP